MNTLNQMISSQGYKISYGKLKIELPIHLTRTRLIINGLL